MPLLQGTMGGTSMLPLQKNAVIHPAVALVMSTTCICWKIGCPAAELIFMHSAGRKQGVIAPTANQLDVQHKMLLSIAA